MSVGKTPGGAGKIPRPVHARGSKASPEKLKEMRQQVVDREMSEPASLKRMENSGKLHSHFKNCPRDLEKKGILKAISQVKI